MKTKKTKKKLLENKIVALLGSQAFFWFILASFVFQAVWLAISARYPMAFDEGFHVGIIKIYSHQWSPILMKQPDGMAPYGALTTDPSYLFHYLMSFPYRLLGLVVKNEVLLLVYLRLLNVAFFALGLVFFRKLLLKTKASPAVVHGSLLFFTLIPIVPLLAAHINYDNFLMLLIPVNLLLVIKFKEQLDKKKINSVFLGNLLTIGLLGSLVKFVYLPILTGIALYLAHILLRYVKSPPRLATAIKKEWGNAARWSRVITMLLLVISTGLFLQRYAVNVVKYQNLIPQCGQVVGVERCQAYGPWARNYKFAQEKTVTTGNPIIFTGGWLGGMFLRLFFTINGPGKVAQYDNRPPLPLITIAASMSFVIGVYMVIRARKRVFSDYALNMMLFVGLIYLIALVGRNYHDYIQLGQMVAINGRYLVLFLPVVIVALAQGYRYVLPQRKLAGFMVITFVMFLQGGGFISFLYGSTPHWYRNDSQSVQDINKTAHDVVHPFILNWPKK